MRDNFTKTLHQGRILGMTSIVATSSRMTTVVMTISAPAVAVPRANRGASAVSLWHRYLRYRALHVPVGLKRMPTLAARSTRPGLLIADHVMMRCIILALIGPWAGSESSTGNRVKDQCIKPILTQK